MTKRMLIDAVHTDETRVVIADEEFIEDYDFVTTSKQQIKGNIYLAKITRVEPSLQAAFVEYGGGKQGFLPFSEIHPDYYQIPAEDKRRLIEEEEAETAREEEEEEKQAEEREQRRSRRGGNDRNRGGRSRRGRGRRRETSDETTEEQQAAAAEGAEATDTDTDTDNPDYQAANAEQYETHSDVVADADQADDETAEDQTTSEDQQPAAAEKTNAAAADASSNDDEDDEDEDVETVGDDDAEETTRRRKGSSFKRYRIQEVIKRNQIILTQVIKEERGNKGVSLTTYISLAGRYCVLMPNSPKAGGVSRKIGNGEQRTRLKEVVAELKDKRGLSAIVRTAGLDRTKAEIRRDYEYLVKLWNQIREDTMASTAPSLIYEESNIIKRSVRDLYTSDVEQIFVQGEAAYKEAKSIMKLIMPSHAPRVKQYKDDLPIFAQYGVEAQLASMHEATAKLPSGGSIVLQATEALISIDVNSGRSTTERNVEETAIKTNLEAAKEVARQLRLRDLAGLVVIDFIDMYYGRNRRTLERAMKDALKHDRAKIQMSRISAFGLMELSRQRLRPSIAESSSITCPHCQGTGMVRSVDTLAMQVIRVIEREAVSGEYTEMKVQCDAQVALFLLNEKREVIGQLEEQHDITVTVSIEPTLLGGQYRIFKVTEDGKEIEHQDSADRRGGKGRRRGGRKRNNNRNSDNQSPDSRSQHHQRKSHASHDADNEDDQSDNNSSPDDKPTNQSSDDKPNPRPRRGRRKAAKPADADSTDNRETSDKEENKESKPSRRRRRPATKSDDTKKEVADAPSSSAAPAEDKPQPSSEKPDTPKAKEEPAIVHSEPAPTTDSTPADPDAPKRRGWWNRVLEN